MKLSVNIGLLGCGTVGSSVAERLHRERDAIERRSGVRYELRAIAIADELKDRPACLAPSLFTRDAYAIVDDPQIDLIIECIGGTADASELVERALDRGRHVITANKDLLATQAPRLHAIAASRGVALRYEAAVCGAIPIVRSLNDALAGDEVRAVAGVLNGTCTAILSEMEEGADYADALAVAQQRGYAEADPSNDVEGVDASHKLALLVQLAFGLAVLSPRIARRGIAGVSRRDIARARMLGYRIRLIAAAVRTPNGALAEVAPLLVPESHAFARTSGPENVARIVSRDAGVLELRGAGAGGSATASAVLGDLVSVLQAIGERHDFSHRGRNGALEAALAVAPLFDDLARHADLMPYPIWNDARLDGERMPQPRHAPGHASHARRAPLHVQYGCPQV